MVRIIYIRSLQDTSKTRVNVWKLLVKYVRSSKKFPSLSSHCCRSVIEKGACTQIGPSVPAISLRGKRVGTVGKYETLL